MIFVYILGALVALVVLILSSPTTLLLHFERDLVITLRIWGISHVLYSPTTVPGKTTQRILARAKKATVELAEELQTTLQEDGVNATIYWLRELADFLGHTLTRYFRSLTVTRFCLQMRVPGEDAAAAAINCGEVDAAVYPLLAVIGTFIQIKRRDIAILPDFFDEGVAVYADAKVRVSLWRLLGAVIAMEVDAVRRSVEVITVEDETERLVNKNG